MNRATGKTEDDVKEEADEGGEGRRGEGGAIETKEVEN